MKVKILEVDKPNHNNRIYLKEVIEKAISQVTYPILGTRLGLDEKCFGINLSKVSHSCNELYLEGDWLIADVKILDTPDGRFLNDLLESKLKIKFSPSGTATIKTENGKTIINDDYKIRSVDYWIED